MSKYGNVPVGKFRSKLEKYCAEQLDAAGVKYEYEPYEVVLVDSFVYPGTVWQKVGGKTKKYKELKRKVRSQKYKPDFVGNGWVIETKGYLTPKARVVWKLFKKHLVDTGKEHWALFMPTNKTEVRQTVKLVSEL